MTVKNSTPRKRRGGRKTKDLSGQPFERLTAVRIDAEKTAAKRATHWVCDCKCGNRTIVAACNLLSGHTTSCGCVQREEAAARMTKHGMKGDPRYQCWKGVRRRCLSEGGHAFDRYGGRGIKVCSRMAEFVGFCVTMGDKPSADHSIDREDNDGNYSCGECDDCKANGWPRNVRWATDVEQGNNKRSNRLMRVGDRVQTMAEWAREYGIKLQTVWNRLEIGWSDEKALTTPVTDQRFGHRNSRHG